MICFSGLLKNIQFFFVTTIALFLSNLRVDFPNVADSPSDPFWGILLTRIPQKLSRCGLHFFTERFADIFQLYWSNLKKEDVFFFLVLVDSLYSDASWRIHPCTAVLAFLIPSSSPGCTLHSLGCNSSRDKLCATEGKVNTDFLVSI